LIDLLVTGLITVLFVAAAALASLCDGVRSR